MSVAAAAVNTVSALVVPAAAGDAYSPATMLSDLTAGALTVLPWVGAGVGGAIALMFAFMGIKKGFQFFRGLAK